MKYIKEIIEGLPIVEIRGDITRTIEDIKYDSRKVNAADAFVAIRGMKQDGHRFVNDVYEKGCRAFIVEDIPEAFKEAVFIKVSDTRRALPHLALNLFDRVVTKLKIIGITGTNGKTTCAYLLHSILEQAHWKPGLISTIEYIIKDKHISAHRTTPESLDLHRLLHRMHANHLKSAVMEVSSHALTLHRTDDIPFSAAVFTNMGHDHLDFHGNMENYFLAKKKLFDGLAETSRAILNMDDPYTERMKRNTAAEIFTYSYSDANATVSVKSHQAVANGVTVSLRIPGGSLTVQSDLIGKHNVYNLLAVVTAAISLGLQNEFIIKGIESLPRVPGRSERFEMPNGAVAFIDYAHTPDALKRILQALMESKPKRIIVVFGCGGDRDFEKRPLMGKIAEDYADVVILTNDNPRSERPEAIIEQIKTGIFDQSKVEVYPDRKEAISDALAMADSKDMILIAGKGHENYQEFADRRIHFDDREVVKSFIQTKN
jgi:UDP-N-acetylmuramoyl-L-alanyl-D-glutamate--2,6-diaminopimelate ligase